MKKLFLLFIICFLIFSRLSVSTSIEVDVNEDVKSQIIHETQSVSINVVNFSSEVYNIGSIPYTARARIFVYNGNKSIFSGWSQEKVLMPGDKKTFDVYWYSSSPENYESKLRIYFGNEIIENEKNNFQVTESLTPEDIFEVENFRTYDNHVVFDTVSKKDVNNVIIIPLQYVPGWIFEQKTIEKVKKNLIKPVLINYYPTVWEPTTLKLAIAAENGKYYSEKIIQMNKKEGITNIIYTILDNLKLLFL